jgi:hypothetical protein
MVAHVCNPDTWEAAAGESWVGGQSKQCYFGALSSKQNTNKKSEGMAQVVKHLPSMCSVLSSMFSTFTKTKIKMGA